MPSETSPTLESNQASPALSCIVTAFTEGELARTAIESILNQSFQDFELLIVDDGADECTRRIIHNYNDPRIVHIRQANDGLSSARNRALEIAAGDYICFLDADDSRPVWAFETMLRTARETEADVVLTTGLLSELRNEIYPFYDHDIIKNIVDQTGGIIDASTPDFISILPYLMMLEPQSANKLIRRGFLQSQNLRFPAGLFFEDIVFHIGMILSLNRVALTTVPCFTYFRRYARPQITSTRGTTRFDAIASSGKALQLLERSTYFHDPLVRLSAITSISKILKWCEESISHNLKWEFRQASLAMIAELDAKFLYTPTGEITSKVEKIAPSARSSLEYFQILRQQATRLTRAQGDETKEVLKNGSALHQ